MDATVRTTGWEDVTRALVRRPASRLRDPGSARAGVALVLRERAGVLQLLFMHRAEHPDDPWSGQMSFPGGRAEPDDPDLRATALRETEEETGLRPGQVRELGRLDDLRARSSRHGLMALIIAPWVFRLVEEVELRPNAEVQSLLWLPLDDLLGPAHRSTMDYPAPEGPVKLPCLRIGERVIWGLTFRMFTNLQELLERSEGSRTGA